MLYTLFADFTLHDFTTNYWFLLLLVVPLLVLLLLEALGLRYIPNDRVGMVEKLWSK